MAAARRHQPARRAQRDARGRVARRPRAVRRVRRGARGAARRDPCSCRSRARATRRCSCAPSAGSRPAARTAADRCTRRAAARCPSALVRARRHRPGRARNCASTRVRMASSGSERTADELGRAFPGIRDHRRRRRASRPHVDASTGARGGDPRRRARSPQGGYRAVILLDGDRMLQADDLRIGESCLRWWSNAAALARAGRARAPGRRRRTRRPSPRDVDAARLRPSRTGRPRAAADAADRARRRARRRPARGRRRARRAARRGARTRRRGDPRTGRPPMRASRALVRFDYALGLRRRREPARARSSPRRCAPARRQGRARPARAIHSEFGSMCPISTCEEAMRLVFAGTPEAGSAVAARGSRHPITTIVAVVTRRDAPLGRKRVLTPSPVAAAADELGTRDRSAPTGSTPATTERITALEPDLGVIVAYGGLVREPLLSAPAHGWINLHFSLLPRWRGAAPVQHALIAGDAVTGASVFQLVAGTRRRRRVRRARAPVRAGRDRGRRARPPSPTRGRRPARRGRRRHRRRNGDRPPAARRGRPTRPSSATTTAASGWDEPRDAIVLGASAA